jgi:hypothetical protein
LTSWARMKVYARIKHASLLHQNVDNGKRPTIYTGKGMR